MDNIKKAIVVVIPLYNEEATLDCLVYRIKGVIKIMEDDWDIRFVLVNDGSSDRTGEILKSSFKDNNKVTIIFHGQNKGYGAALRTGLNAALGKKPDFVVTIDADTNYDHFLIPLLVKEINDEFDIVTASPWHPDGEGRYFPFRRLILSKGLSFLYRFILRKYGNPLYCYSSAFRVYRRTVLEKINFTGDDFLANSEILVKAIIMGFRVKECPTHVNPRWFGMSKMQKRKQMVSHLKFMKRIITEKEQMLYK